MAALMTLNGGYTGAMVSLSSGPSYLALTTMFSSARGARCLHSEAYKTQGSYWFELFILLERATLIRSRGRE